MTNRYMSFHHTIVQQTQTTPTLLPSTSTSDPVSIFDISHNQVMNISNLHEIFTHAKSAVVQPQTVMPCFRGRLATLITNLLLLLLLLRLRSSIWTASHRLSNPVVELLPQSLHRLPFFLRSGSLISSLPAPRRKYNLPSLSISHSPIVAFGPVQYGSDVFCSFLAAFNPGALFLSFASIPSSSTV